MGRVYYSFRPLGEWPREKTASRDSGGRFQSGWDSTLRLLGSEVNRIQFAAIRDDKRAQISMAIGLAVTANQLRADGAGLLAGERPAHPGVMVAFESKFGPLKFYCDFFLEWRHNVRGIAMTLERLRLADLYGVTKRGEQYTGWKALPPGIVTPPPRMTLEEAAQFMARDVSGCVPAALVSDPDNVRRAYREKALKLHPDVNDGNLRPEWLTLQQAKEVLDLHHGGLL